MKGTLKITGKCAAMTFYFSADKDELEKAAPTTSNRISESGSRGA
ncbi:MAG: hypothetical protein ACRBB5_00270 [Nitrosopumilus sp.]